jgi:beta-1,4-mannosyltransferase
MTGAAPSRRVVLHTFAPAAQSGNPFTTLLSEAIDERPGWTSRYFSWGEFLSLRWDVLHIHWPEFLIRDRSPRVAKVKQILFETGLRLARSRGRVVVRTLHNSSPHELRNGEHELLRRIDLLTDGFIRMNEFTVSPVPGAPIVTIPHGHYRDWYGALARSPEVVENRALVYGAIRPYKGVPKLIRAFQNLPPSSPWTLRVVGKISDPEVLASPLTDRVSIRDERVTDEDLILEISAAARIVLPFDRVENSGTMILALSLATPVVTTRSNSAVSLRTAVGDDWVRIVDDMAADQLEHALARPTPHGEPFDSAPTYEWDLIASATIDFYVEQRRRVVSGREKTAPARIGS